MAHIELKNVSKKFGNQTALRNLDLEIADGEFFVLLGETGAGKTTTLRLVAGLEKPTEGQVFIDGIDVADWGAAERDVALVLQQYSLYPRYTVRQNLEFPLKSKLQARRRCRDRRARRARGQDVAHRASPGAQDRPAVGRRDAARLDRPRHRAQPARLFDGRAAVGARRQAARDAEDRAQEHPDESRPDLPVRHPRPDRGDVDGRQDRRPQQWPAGAVGHALRDLQQPARTPSSPARSARRR